MGAESYSFFSEMEAGEGANILRSAVQERQSRLGPEPEARRAIQEFCLELERTRAANPGIERRRCILEYTSFIVEKQLTEALRPVRAGAAKFVRNLVYGDRVLGKSGAAGIESIMEDQKNTVGAVSPALVLEAAQIFHAPGAERLFSSLWQVENFQDWRRLYGNAARHGEALLVGTC